MSVVCGGTSAVRPFHEDSPRVESNPSSSARMNSDKCIRSHRLRPEAVKAPWTLSARG